jgi:nucleolar complex protein 2
MGKKAVKATRKFAASGQLKKTIQARKKHQEIRRKTQGKQKRRDGRAQQRPSVDDEGEGEVDSVDGDKKPRSGKSK